MTIPIIIMMILGLVFIFASFFISEKLTKKESDFNIDLLTINDDYQFSERELGIIKRKIEDVIANQAKDILYETNESLSSMANEKTMALGDYAVAVCEQIEKNHKEVMFLYSMLDDKQKEIMKTVQQVDDMRKQLQPLADQLSSGEKTMAANVQKSKETEAHMDVVLAEAKALQEQENSKEVIQPHKQTAQPEHAQSIKEEKVLSAAPADTEQEQQDSVEDLEDVFQQFDDADTDFEDTMDEEFEANSNSNEIILEMHRNGNSIIDIAKQLGLGVGEVKLVIDLYQGE